MDAHYMNLMGMAPKEVTHWEHWSNPDAETYLTGIDYYDHPRLCRLKLQELYPELGLPVPEKDDPIARPDMEHSSDSETHSVRWGDGQSWTFRHGEDFFEDPEDCFAFSPLAKGDFRDWPHVVENYDYSDEEKLYRGWRSLYPETMTAAPEGHVENFGFYNTMFMWPLLCFGWENFMISSLDERFERIMEEFREINRRVFRSIAKLPVNFVTCHDDIVTARGPVCSPEWMRKYIFPAYEEFWGILRESGKEVIFMADGCMDAYADDIMALGARGIITEPYTDFKKLARKYPNMFLGGEGDNRILMTSDKNEIKKMVLSMTETAKMCGGYVLSIGNHIPWNVPGEAIKYYLDYCREYAWR